MAKEAGQLVQIGAQQGRIVGKMFVFFQQQLYALFARHAQYDARRLPHRMHEAIRYPEIADLFALGLYEHNAGRIKMAQRVPQSAFERPLRWLRLGGQTAEH